MSMTTNNLTHKTFGLLGGFEGDDAKFKAAVTLTQRLLLSNNTDSSHTTAVSVQDVVATMDKLPLSGRIALMMHGVAPSPACNEIVKALFHWCFQEEEAQETNGKNDDEVKIKRKVDNLFKKKGKTTATTITQDSDIDEEEAMLDEEFVLVRDKAAEDLNPLRFYVLRVLSMSTGFLGDAGVWFCHAYLNTTNSTICRSFVLEGMAKNSSVTDDQLEAAYDQAVASHQEAIVSICTKAKHRYDFLLRLYQRGVLADYKALYTHPDSAVVVKKLVKEKPEAPFLKWVLHADLYLGMLKESLEQFLDDPIGRGAALRAWERHCCEAADFSPKHAAAVLDLCDHYCPMEIAGSVADNYVRSIIIKASAAGELGEKPNDFEQVVAALPVSCRKVDRKRYAEWIFSQVKPCEGGGGVGFVDPTREAFLLNELANRSIITQLQDNISTYLDGVSNELFWRALILRDKNSEATCAVRFFRAISTIVKSLSEDRLVNAAREATFAWCRLHFRCQPPAVNPVDDDSDHEKKEKVISDWKLWRASYFSVVSTLVANVTRRHDSAICASAPTGLSRATLWVGFSRILLDLDIDGLVAMYTAGFVNKVDHAVELMRVIESVEKTSHQHCAFITTCDALAERTVAIVKEHLMPVLVMTDAPTQNELSTAMNRLIPGLLGLCSRLWNDRPGLLVDVARFIHFVSEAARPSEALFANPCVDKSYQDKDGRKKRTFYRVDVNKEQTRANLLITSNVHGILQLLCAHCSRQNTENEEGRLLSVAVLRREELQRDIKEIFSWFPIPAWMQKVRDGKEEEGMHGETNGTRENDIDFRLRLVRLVSIACPEALESETAMLVALGRLLLLDTNEYSYERFDHHFEALGLNVTILENADEQLRHKFLVANNGKVAAPGVREYLEEQTHNRDPTARMNAHLSLLRLSLNNGLAEFARSLQFVAGRTKNEAGIYRSSLLDWLAQHAFYIAGMSFAETESATSEEKERSTIESVEAVCEGFTKMLRDDVSKRDTVGKARFVSVSKELIRCCIGSNKKRLLHTGCDLHSVWMTEAVRLQWIVVEVTGGEIRLRDFTWQVPNGSMDDNWVDPEMIDSFIQPILETNYGSGAKIIMRRVHAVTHHGGHLSDAKALSSQERVSLLVEALKTVKHEHAEMNADAAAVTLQDDDVLSESQLHTLFSLVKHRWVEVPILVNATENNAIQSNETTLPEFEQAYRMFVLLCSFYDGDLWCHVPCLASVCTSLLGAAVRRGRLARDILNIYWLAMRRRLAILDFSDLNQSPAVCSFFLFILGAPLKYEILAVVNRRAEKKGLPYDFSCSLARSLLGLTPSAWYLPEVKEVIAKSRDDVLADLFEDGGNSAEAAHGTFCPNNDPPFTVIDSAVQTQLRSKALRLYTDYCLAIALSRNYSVQVRSSRISEFVGAPCTGYRDILELLQDLEEGPLLESLLLGVFRVDSAWKVLAYLLRPSVIAARSHRTTAGLLDRVAKDMHTRDVVLVFSVLLKEGSRQKSLTPYMLKCIMRALFCIDSESSATLVRNQWRRETMLHKDVRHDLVRLAVLALVASLRGSNGEKVSDDGHLMQVAWEIVEGACGDSSLELDSAVLILAPYWSGAVFHSTDPLRSRGADDFVRVLSSPPTRATPQWGATKKGTPQEEAFREVETKILKAREEETYGLGLDSVRLLYADTRISLDRYEKALRLLSEQNTSAAVRVKARCHGRLFASSCLLGVDDESSTSVLQDLRNSLHILLSHAEAPSLEAGKLKLEHSVDLDAIETTYELVALSSQLAAFTMNAVQQKYWDLPGEVRSKDPENAISVVAKGSIAAKMLVQLMHTTTKVLLATPPCLTNRTWRLSGVIYVVFQCVDMFQTLSTTNSTKQDLSGLMFGSLEKQMRLLKLAGSAMNSLPLKESSPGPAIALFQELEDED